MLCCADSTKDNATTTTSVTDSSTTSSISLGLNGTVTASRATSSSQSDGSTTTSATTTTSTTTANTSGKDRKRQKQASFSLGGSAAVLDFPVTAYDSVQGNTNYTVGVELKAEGGKTKMVLTFPYARTIYYDPTTTFDIAVNSTTTRNGASATSSSWMSALVSLVLLCVALL